MPNLFFISLIFFLIAIALPLVPFVLGPLLLRLLLKQSASPEIGVFNPDSRRLPESVADFFDEVRDELEPLGFEVVDGLTLPNQTPNVRCVALMLANRKTRDYAWATVVHATSSMGLVNLKSAFVEFVSRFRGGDIVIVQTNNSFVVGAFRLPPQVTSTQFPTVREADRLYDLHQALAQKHGNEEGKFLRLDEEFQGDAAAFGARVLVEELENQVPTGFLYYSARGNVYRATWKGACLMAWAQCWPFSVLRKARRDRKAQRLLEELEG